MLKRLCILLLLAAPAAAADNPVLVELFTSQGCSSCPPADRLLGKLAERDDLLALAFHVTYWNYIGWKDSFATEATTRRQHAYAKAFGRANVYTPQMVVGGLTHMVGSEASAIEGAVGAARSRASQVAVAFDGPLVTAGGGDGAGALWLACYDARHDVEIARGENGGRTLSYFNVVRHLEKLADWRGAPLSTAVDLEAQRVAGRSGCAAILQRAPAGAVLGAARMRLTERSAAR